MIDVSVERVIARPRDAVAAFAMDWRNDREWIGALTEVRLVSDGPFGVGSRVSRTARFLGREFEYVNEITELEPDRALGMRSVKAPFPMTVRYEFEDADGGGTRMRIRTGGEVGGFYRLAGPALAAAVRRGVSQDLERLDARLR
jgi:uncharacterized membrane protein